MKGKKHSAESKEKMRQKRLGVKPGNYGKKTSPEVIQKLKKAHIGQVAWNKGKKLTEEHCRNLQLARKKWLNSLSEEERKNILGGFRKGQIPWNKGKTGFVAWNKGQKMSLEFCEKMSKIHKNMPNKGLFKKGHIGYKAQKGKKFSLEHRKKISKGHINKNIGINNGNWKGGTAKIGRLIKGMPEYKQWRLDIFIRDNKICHKCGSKENLIVHYIKAKHLIIKQNDIKTTAETRACNELWNVNNGITLCKECLKRHK